MQIGKETQVFLFTDDMIVYINDPKILKIFLEIINKFINVAAYTINLYKSIALLYTYNRKWDHGHTPINNSLRKRKSRNKPNQGSK